MTTKEGQQEEEGEKTGFTGWMRSFAPDIVKNNAPRIVAGLKIIGCSSMLFSKNRVFSLAGAGFIGAFSLIGLFGGKKSDEEKARLAQEAQEQSAPDGLLSDYINKITHPSKYPLEAGTGIAMLSSTVWTASGIFGKGGFSPGRLAGGALSFASDANIVFTKEEIGEEKTNPHAKGSLRYYLTELKHRPVLLSSLFNIGSDLASIAGGAHEYKRGKEANTMMAGGFLLAANTFQALFVDKNDYNVEAKKSASVEGPRPENVTVHSLTTEAVQQLRPVA